jgi:hypothetical protein
MNVFSVVFKELYRPVNYAKTFFSDKANSYKELSKNVRENINNNKNKPPVHQDLKLSDYKKRLRGLQIHCYILLSFLIYSSLYFLTVDTNLQALVVMVIFLFFAINYISSIYRLWLARKYLLNWHLRDVRINNTFRMFLDEVFISPVLLLPSSSNKDKNKV